MLKKLILFVVVLALSSLDLAQQQKVPARRPKVGSDATTDCEVKYSSGKGSYATQFCITENGNIAQFSIGGQTQ